MEEKLDKFDYFILALISLAILLIIAAFFYTGYLKVNEQRYENIISGEIIEIKAGEAINPAGFVVSPGVGVALAEPGTILVKTDKEIINVSVRGISTVKIEIGRKAIIKEKGIVREGKKIREELILLSVE